MAEEKGNKITFRLLFRNAVFSKQNKRKEDLGDNVLLAPAAGFRVWSVGVR